MPPITSYEQWPVEKLTIEIIRERFWDPINNVGRPYHEDGKNGRTFYFLEFFLFLRNFFGKITTAPADLKFMMTILNLLFLY